MITSLLVHCTLKNCMFIAYMALLHALHVFTRILLACQTQLHIYAATMLWLLSSLSSLRCIAATSYNAVALRCFISLKRMSFSIAYCLACITPAQGSERSVSSATMSTNKSIASITPASERLVNDVLELSFSHCTTEKSLSTEVVFGNAVAKPPHSIRSNGKRPFMQSHASLKKVFSLWASRAALRCGSWEWARRRSRCSLSKQVVNGVNSPM